MIKKLLLSVGAAVFLAAGTSQAQTVSNLLGTLNLGDAANKVYNTAKEGGLFSATNYAVEPYLTYAPSLKSGDKVGGGILAVYNFNTYVAGGLGIDYLGQFSLVSGNLSLRAPINVGSYADKYAPNSWTNTLNEITVVPFVLGGIGSPFNTGGASGVCTIADVGGYVQYGHLWGGKFNTGVCWGEWMNAGDYTGKRYHIFVGWSHGF
jgi:hypothetical protein